jgi:molecular chaperone GrpE (heat shock protein)
MLQKCAILGLVLLLAGGLAFAWRYGETRNERQQAQSLVPANSLGSESYLEKYGHWHQLSPEQQNQLVLELDGERKSKTADQLGREQQARLRADLDKLAAGQMNPGDIADFLYGRGWENQVEQYKKHKEQMEIAQTISIVCLSIGSVLFGGCAILWLLWLVVRAIRALRRRSCEPQAQTEREVAKLTDIDPPSSEDDLEAPVSEEQPKQRRKRLTRSDSGDSRLRGNDVTAAQAGVSRAQTSAEPRPGESIAEQPAGIDDLFHVTSPPQDGASVPARQKMSCGDARPAADGGWATLEASRPSPAVQTAAEGSDFAVLLADESSQERDWSPEAQWSLQSAHKVPSEGTPRERGTTRPSTARISDRPSAPTAENTLKEQAEDLQKQIAEFKQMAQNVQQVTREQSEPLSNTLKELTQQVSAIREYAASQQDRVEKLQDGYDWGIIRTFCLRVIRCVDNLEGRLADLPQDDGAAAHLEEVRDELVFALESSSVEQFRPEINSEFHGQEKLAEAIKEKQPAKRPDQSGRIARVIRPGYRYMIDNENFRVVRTAQVELFG